MKKINKKPCHNFFYPGIDSGVSEAMDEVVQIDDEVRFVSQLINKK